jgi:hypothetical protein
MTHGHRLLLKWARTAHVYLTLFGLVLLLMFAVTGFLLRHEEWFVDERKTHEHTTTGTIPPNYLAPLDELMVVEILRKDLGVTGALDRPEGAQEPGAERPGLQKEGDDKLRAVFRGPGRECEASIRLADGATTVTHRSWGLVRVLTDLHRGKSTVTGPVWGLVVDGVSILFVIVSITGLILWSSLRNRARHGLLVIGLGLAMTLVVYFVFVP